MGLVIHNALADKAIFLHAFKLFWNRQILLLEFVSQSNELRAHSILLPILELVFLVVEDLTIGLAVVLAEHRDCLVACPMIKGKKMNAELVVDILRRCFTLIVFLGLFDAKSVILHTFLDS